ncbi:DUF5808 domain-containing protein [Paenibacillus stellifer]
MTFKKVKLLVPKDSGIGWTLNLRHPFTWLVLAALFVIAVMRSFFIK